jgi:hypothetical protein
MVFEESARFLRVRLNIFPSVTAITISTPHSCDRWHIQSIRAGLTIVPLSDCGWRLCSEIAQQGSPAPQRTYEDHLTPVRRQNGEKA